MYVRMYLCMHVHVYCFEQVIYCKYISQRKADGCGLLKIWSCDVILLKVFQPLSYSYVCAQFCTINMYMYKYVGPMLQVKQLNVYQKGWPAVLTSSSVKEEYASRNLINWSFIYSTNVAQMNSSTMFRSLDLRQLQTSISDEELHDCNTYVS